MEDPELEAIRAKRLAELQGNYKGGDGADSKAAEEQKKAEEMKNAILSQIMDQSARARLNTLKLAKPEKAMMVENMLVQMAKTGQLMGKLGETEFIGILERVSEQLQKKTTIKFDRRRILDDSDEDDL